MTRPKRRRCVCVYQRTGPRTWALRLIHPKCPAHGTGGTRWQVTLKEQP